MGPSDFPSHLRPVPISGDSTAPQIDNTEGGTLGLTPPISRGRSNGFVTDVLLELGYLDRERVEHAVEQARSAGKPPERLLVEQGAISSDQLSRAMAERYGLD